MTPTELRILVADDHPLVRKGLTDLLKDWRTSVVVDEAARGDVSLHMALGADWDVVILDITMPGCSGLDVLKGVKAARPDLPVVMLSMHSSSAHVSKALKLGASGYVTKESAPTALLTAIQAALAGETYLSLDLERQRGRNEQSSVAQST